MPLLIRIISQGVAMMVLGSLAFLGINPDIHILSPEEQVVVDKQQQKIVQEVLAPESPQQAPTEIEKKIEPIAEKITEQEVKVQKAVQQAISVPQIQRGESNLIESRGDFYDNVVVNIVCLNKVNNTIKMTTGSGVIISSSGIILTNSHVANAFLFDDKSKTSYKDCSIRRENIPTYGFNAKVVFISDDWLLNNQSFFSKENPKGSGQDDFALLAITNNTNPVLPVPSQFEYAPILTSDLGIRKEIPITVAAYPGMHTGVFEVDSNGKLKKAETFVSDIMTFGSNSADIISTGPNEVAKRGSSGGGVFDGRNLLGIVVTTDTNKEGSFINAITLPYISADFSLETGENLKMYLSKDKNILISDYADDVFKLKKLIAKFL